MSTAFIRAALIGVAIMPACAQTFAEEPAKKIDPTQPGGAIVEDVGHFSPSVMSPEQNDLRIVHWLSVDNRGMVECAKAAADRSSNEAVKSFAREIAAEHGSFQDKVFAKRLGQGTSNRTEDAHRGTTGTLVRDDGRLRDGKLLFRPTDFVAVKERVCEQLQSKARKEMESLSGPEFDHAFVAHMAFGHEALIASIDVLNNDATDGLRSDLKSFRDMLDKHLTHVRDLQKQIRGGDTAARSTNSEIK
jgi:predicted outer membrane protein